MRYLPMFVPVSGCICLLGLSCVVNASALAFPSGAEKCSRGHVTCKCGQQRERIRISVRRCSLFDGFNSYCDYCTHRRNLKRHLCPRYHHCSTCTSEGCGTCPPNKYGRRCTKDCSSLCFNGGTCIDRRCQCPDGFTGDRCQRGTECRIVTKPAHGDVEVSGMTATYTCSHGYSLVGQHILQCRPNGTWSSESPYCEAICKNPNASDHMYFVRDRLDQDEAPFTALAKVKVKCDDGYRVVGARSIYCKLDGMWSSVPKCEKRKTCTPPSIVANGIHQTFEEVRDDRYYEGTEVIYECNQGYVLDGQYSLVCEEDGEWNHGTPRCKEVEQEPKVTCPTLTVLVHGSLTQGPESPTNKNVPGIRVVYECDVGFVLHPNIPERYCHIDGAWYPPVQPKCVPVVTCPDPGTPKKGIRCFGNGCIPGSRNSTCPSSSHVTVGNETVFLPEGNYGEGARVYYKCNQAYNMIGPKFRRCQEDGTWTASLPHCIPECGKPTQGSTALISGGTESKSEDWPWHVVVMKKTPWKEWRHVCGGCLLGDAWVITAAHCVTEDQTTNPLDISDIVVKFGVTHINDSNGDQLIQSKGITKIYVNDNYSSRTYDSDIALLKLKKSVTVNARVQPACLSKQQTSRGNQTNRSDQILPRSVVTGFGKVANTEYSQTLRSAELNVEPNNRQCEKVLSKDGVNNRVTRNMFCADNVAENKHPCAGDSGGPLVRQSSHGQRRWYLEGIVSWASERPCQGRSSYSVFTKVDMFLDWIEETTSPDLSYY
ncbi:clotting factor C-like isoform X1 [Haliotis cracherodii]|uniref:clotting factor C-like isoform X1 n=1 Tax=Haliotis cracherodii TaxID=6455 RepID=UPI0039ED416B